MPLNEAATGLSPIATSVRPNDERIRSTASDADDEHQNTAHGTRPDSAGVDAAPTRLAERLGERAGRGATRPQPDGAVQHQHHPERRDERRHLEHGGDQAVDEPDERPRRRASAAGPGRCASPRRRAAWPRSRPGHRRASRPTGRTRRTTITKYCPAARIDQRRGLLDEGHHRRRLGEGGVDREDDGEDQRRAGLRPWRSRRTARTRSGWLVHEVTSAVLLPAAVSPVTSAVVGPRRRRRRNRARDVRRVDLAPGVEGHGGDDDRRRAARP